MLNQLSEKQLHRIRWLLTIGWIVLIFSLFYDPISPLLTQPNNVINLEACVKVQGECLPIQSYAMGASIWWGIVVPASIFMILVFGH